MWISVPSGKRSQWNGPGRRIWTVRAPVSGCLERGTGRCLWAGVTPLRGSVDNGLREVPRRGRSRFSCGFLFFRLDKRDAPRWPHHTDAQRHNSLLYDHPGSFAACHHRRRYGQGRRDIRLEHGRAGAYLRPRGMTDGSERMLLPIEIISCGRCKADFCL